MKKNLSIIVVCFLLSIKCFAFEDSLSAIKVEVKVVNDYGLKFAKEPYLKNHFPFFKYDLAIDSIIERNYDIEITIKNTSEKPVSIWLMSCSWYDNFKVNNNYVYLRIWNCDVNGPEIVKFNPGESKGYKATLYKSIEFDYPSNGAVHGSPVETTKLGLIEFNRIYDREGKPIFNYRQLMGDKSSWNIIWSNPLYLLGKQPEPKSIVIYKDTQ